MISEKICKRCSALKPVAEFNRRASERDGLRSECKACVSEINRAQYQKHADKRRAGQRAYYREHREQCVAAARRWQDEHPEQTRATRIRWQRTEGWATTLVCTARATARRKGYAFDLDANFVRELHARQNGRCYWLGIELVCADEARNPLQPSIDRIDCDAGYTRDNVVLASQFANMGRSNIEASRFRIFVERLEQSFQSKAAK